MWWGGGVGVVGGEVGWRKDGRDTKYRILY